MATAFMPGGRPLLGLEDDRELLAVKDVGRGRVYLFGTSPDPAWSNLAVVGGGLALWGDRE